MDFNNLFCRNIMYIWKSFESIGLDKLNCQLHAQLSIHNYDVMICDNFLSLSFAMHMVYYFYHYCINYQAYLRTNNHKQPA